MITEKLYHDYLSMLLAGDRSGCINIVKGLLESGIQIKVLYIQLFQRSLYEVGVLWELNKISVALEHLCTSITEGLIILAYPYMFAAEHSGKKAVITCTPGEFHQVGARMVADYFELNGWDSYFLGSNSPDAELVSTIAEKHPDLIAISISVFFNMNSLVRQIGMINKHFPKLGIIVGGQGFSRGRTDFFKPYSNVQIITSLDDLDRKILNHKF